MSSITINIILLYTYFILLTQIITRLYFLLYYNLPTSTTKPTSRGRESRGNKFRRSIFLDFRAEPTGPLPGSSSRRPLKISDSKWPAFSSFFGLLSSRHITNPENLSYLGDLVRIPLETND